MDGELLDVPILGLVLTLHNFDRSMDDQFLSELAEFIGKSLESLSFIGHVVSPCDSFFNPWPISGKIRI